MDSVDIRELAVPDLADVASIHEAAFPNAALTRLGTEAVCRYYAWQLTGPHDAVAFAACARSEMTGFCVGGSFRGALSGFLSQNRAFLAWRLVTHPWLISNEIVRRRLPLAVKALNADRTPGHAIPPNATRERSFGVLSIAVRPEWHGHHIGTLLMMAAEAAARARGFRAMHLTVAPDNQRAVQFYEHLQWDRVPIDGQWQGAMRKTLDASPLHP